MAEDQPRGKKRSKGYYARTSQGKKMMRRAGALEAGMRGFLLTCNRQEALCVRDGYSLLGQYADQLYGPEDNDDSNGDSNATSENESDSDLEDIEASIQKEVAQMKRKRAEKAMRFQSMDSGAKNVIFIRTKLPDPTELVHHILSDLARTQTCRCRHILRLLPVALSCRAGVEDIAKHAPNLLGPHFHAEGAQATTFAVRIKIRNNGRVGRDEVIKAVAAAVMEKGPGHKVDLDRPQLTVLIEVVRNVCCMSVLRDFEELRRYNVQEIVAASSGGGSKGPAAPGRIAQGNKDTNQKVDAAPKEASAEPPAAGQDQENPLDSQDKNPNADASGDADKSSSDQAKLGSEENGKGPTTENPNTTSSPTD